MNMKKILAIGAHFDDIELGCGGTLWKWKNQGCHITLFTACRSGYRDFQGNIVRSSEVAHTEGINAAKSLEANLIRGNFPTFGLEFTEPLNGKLISILQDVQPDIVLTHWAGDVHHDHRALAMATLHCCRHIPRVLMYRSNWYNSDQHFEPRFLIDISDVFERKIELIKIYHSENERTQGQWLEYIRSQGRLLGLKVGVDYAEGFEIVKWLM